MFYTGLKQYHNCFIIQFDRLKPYQQRNNSAENDNNADKPEHSNICSEDIWLI